MAGVAVAMADCIVTAHGNKVYVDGRAAMLIAVIMDNAERINAMGNGRIEFNCSAGDIKPAIYETLASVRA